MLDNTQAQVEKLHPLTTHNRCGGHCQRLSVTEYPTGDVQVTAIRFDPETRFGNKSKKTRKNETKKEMSETTLRKSQNRSRKLVLKKALTMQADRMLTLTFKENLTDLSKAWDIYKYFAKLMRWRYGERFIYIVVPEFQKRGAVHFHLAVKGFYHANTVRKLWLRAAGSFGGNIDITSPRKYQFNSWNPKRIAQYLAKYISKNDSVDFNARRYASTKSLKPPAAIVSWLPMGVPVISVMIEIINDMTRLPVQTIWENNRYFSVSYVST